LKRYEKGFRRCAAAFALCVALAVLLAPFAGARYNENVANINSQFSKVTAVEADNLMIDLMNRLYPVGCIYMSTTISNLTGANSMQEHFGGTWARFAQGRVPMGVDPATPAYATALLTGGAMNSAGTATTITLPAAGLSVGGTIGLTPGNAVNSSATGTLTIPHPDNVVNFAVTLPTIASIAGSHTLSATQIPTHNHGVGTYHVGHRNPRQNASGGTWWARVDETANAAQTNVVNQPGGGSWRLNIGNWGTAATTAFTATFATMPNLNSTTFTRTPTFPTATYTLPTIEYQQQTVSGYNLTAGAGSGTVTVPDNTLQPYEICYMYVRMTLAPLN